MTPNEIITEALYNIYGSSTVEESVSAKAKGLLTRIHKEVQRKAPWWFLWDTLNITTQRGDIKSWRLDGICELPSKPWSVCVTRDKIFISCNTVGDFFEGGTHTTVDTPERLLIIDKDTMQIIDESQNGGRSVARDPVTGLIYVANGYIGTSSIMLGNKVLSDTGVYLYDFSYPTGVAPRYPGDFVLISVYNGRIYYSKMSWQGDSKVCSPEGTTIITDFFPGISAVPEGVICGGSVYSDSGEEIVTSKLYGEARVIYDGEVTFRIREEMRENSIWYDPSSAYGGTDISLVEYDYQTNRIKSSVPVKPPMEGWYSCSQENYRVGYTQEVPKGGACDDCFCTVLHDETNDKYYAIRLTTREIGLIKRIYQDDREIERVESEIAANGDRTRYYMDREYSSGKRVLSFFPETKSIANCECIVYRRIDYDFEDSVCSNLEDYLIKKLTSEISLVTEYADRFTAYAAAAEDALTKALAHGADFDAQEIEPGYADA